MNTTPWTQLWLDYKKVNGKGNEAFVTKVRIEGFEISQPVIKNALQELKRGVQGMLGIEAVAVQETTEFKQAKEDEKASDFGLRIVRKLWLTDSLEGVYHLKRTQEGLTLAAGEESGILYGIFHILRLIATEQELGRVDIYQSPSQPLRMINHWDNLDGSIERGYSGRSFYFNKNEFLSINFLL